MFNLSDSVSAANSIISKVLNWASDCSNVGEGCWWKMYVGEKPVCWWNLKFSQEHTFHQHTEKVSPTYFTNIHLNFCSKCSPTYRKFFTNILHQHTFNFLFKFFTNIQFFSPTYRKLFANILHQHTLKFLSSPTYRKFFTDILFFTNMFRQHHYSQLSAIFYYPTLSLADPYL